MTYRDESVILREKLLELEAESARLEGRAAGLEVALQEAVNEAEDAQAALDDFPRQKARRWYSAKVLGCIGALVALGAMGGSCVACIVCTEWVNDEVDDDWSGQVDFTSVPSLADGTRCSLRLFQADQEDPCRATLTCDGQRRYSALGSCANAGRGNDPEYWDRDAAGIDGDRSLAVSVRNGVALLREGTGIARIRLEGTSN